MPSRQTRSAQDDHPIALPTRAQIEELRAAGRLEEPEDLRPEGASYQVLVPSQGLAPVEIR